MIQLKRNDFLIKPFLKRDNFKATFQIFSTLTPIFFLWITVSQIRSSELLPITKACFFAPIIILLTLLSSRTFSLMHDCGHNSLFDRRSLNNLFGFLLGVMNGIPQKPWSNDHSFHHRNNESIQRSIDVLSLEDYNSLSKRKIIYK